MSRTSTITPELKRVYHLNYVGKPGNRLKLRCRERCAYAIKSGKLTRMPCEVCGEVKSEAHHEDYSKPFDVKWFCRKCHGAAHRKSHCPQGHALTEDNIHMSKHGRSCRECHRASNRRSWQRRTQVA